jgi:PleD family two-component response regulator
MQSQDWEIDSGLNFQIDEGQHEDTYYRLLIVHDDLSVIDRLSQLFPKERFEILIAYDGLDALQKVRTYNPHCILTKAFLPGLNGLMLTRIVKYDKRFKHIPVIMFMSGLTQTLKQELPKVGVNEVILEPYNNRKVLSAVVNQVYSLGVNHLRDKTKTSL